MAVPSYTTDLTTINDCSSTSTPDTWSEPTGMTAGTTIVAQTDFYIEGSACISKLTNTTGTSGAGFVDASGATTLTSGEAFWFWIYHIGAKALDTRANGGLQVIVGSSLANYYAFYLEGNNTYVVGGWKRVPIDPTLTGNDADGFAFRNRTQGTPTGSWVAYGGGAVQLSAVAGASLGIDYVAYGRDLIVESGSVADGLATFAGTASADSTGAWGLMQFTNGAYYLQGHLILGTATNAVDFRDTGGASVFIQNTPKVDAAFNEIEIRNASSRVDWGAISFTALGNQSQGKLTVTDNADINIDACSFTNMGTFTLLAATAITNSTLRSCDTITAPGSDLRGTSILTSRVAADAGALIWNVATNPDGLLDNMTFSKGTNAHHAIDFGTSVTGNITLRECEFTGFGSTGDSNDSTVRFLATGGSLTLSLVGCTVNGSPATTGNFSVDDAAGIAVTLSIDPVTVLVNVKNVVPENIQDARVFLKASSGGPFPVDVTVTISNSGTTATVTHTAHGLANNDKVVISGASLIQNLGVFTITLDGVDPTNKYTYTMASAPGSSPTGTIKSTFVVLEGLTNASGNITMSRVFPSNQPVTGWARKSTSAPYYKEGAISGTVNSSSGFSATILLISDE